MVLKTTPHSVMQAAIYLNFDVSFELFLRDQELDLLARRKSLHATIMQWNLSTMRIEKINPVSPNLQQQYTQRNKLSGKLTIPQDNKIHKNHLKQLTRT